jgi:hypothetical protein
LNSCGCEGCHHGVEGDKEQIGDFLEQHLSASEDV